VQQGKFVGQALVVGQQQFKTNHQFSLVPVPFVHLNYNEYHRSKALFMNDDGNDSNMKQKRNQRDDINLKSESSKPKSNSSFKQKDKRTTSSSNSSPNSSPNDNDIFFIEEPRLLIGDIISLLLACQLMGLVDVLNTPEFWISGGFAQPVDLSPEGGSTSTLGTLVKRDSVMSIAWVVSSIKNRGYTLGTIVDDLTAIKCSFAIFLDYCSILIIFALVQAFGTNASVNAIEIVRQSYYTILMICSFRFIYGRVNR
jgi:hypothetical protein